MGKDQKLLHINNNISLLLLMLMLGSIPASASSSASSSATNNNNIIYNVISFGARGDGVTESTKAFRDAWAAACGSIAPTTTIFVPKGRYLLLPVVFGGQYCSRRTRINFWIKGTLVAPSDYRILGTSHNWLSFEAVNGVSIFGGILDAKGPAFWACKAASAEATAPLPPPPPPHAATASANRLPSYYCPVDTGATSLSFTNSNNILIQGLLSVNSQMFHIVINGCKNVHLQGIHIRAPANSPNTDGIHVQSSNNIAILAAIIGTGDDCISIGPGTTNLWVEGVRCGPGHGISIGSLAKDMEEQGVQNVTVTNTVFTATDNGLRIKSWPRPSNGFVHGVLFQRALMDNVRFPVLIDQNYCPGRKHRKHCPSSQESGVTVKNVTYKEIKGTSATAVAIKFHCSATNPCTSLRLEDVKLSYVNDDATSQSFCRFANGQAYGFVQPLSCL